MTVQNFTVKGMKAALVRVESSEPAVGEVSNAPPCQGRVVNVCEDCRVQWSDLGPFCDCYKLASPTQGLGTRCTPAVKKELDQCMDSDRIWTGYYYCQLNQEDAKLQLENAPGLKVAYYPETPEKDLAQVNKDFAHLKNYAKNVYARNVSMPGGMTWSMSQVLNLFIIKVYANRFPQVDDKSRKDMRLWVIGQLIELHNGRNPQSSGTEYAKLFASKEFANLEMPEQLKALLENVRLLTVKRTDNQTSPKELIKRFDVVLVSAYADADATFTKYYEASNRTNFNLGADRPWICVLHAAAINIGEWRDNPPVRADDFADYSPDSKEVEGTYVGKLDDEQYVKDMQLTLSMVFHAAMQEEMNDLVLFPFGMGAFHRHLYEYDKEYRKAEHLKTLKLKLTKMMFQLMADFAIDSFEHLQRIHICLGLNVLYRSGDVATDSGKFPELTVNHDAFMISAVEMAKERSSHLGWHRIQSMLQFHIHKDAFDLAQEIASEPPKGVGGKKRVMLLNAANAKLLGNHWFTRGAKQAIDENLHRRSSTLAATSLHLNAGADVRSDRQPDELKNRVLEFGGQVGTIEEQDVGTLKPKVAWEFMQGKTVKRVESTNSQGQFKLILK